VIFHFPILHGPGPNVIVNESGPDDICLEHNFYDQAQLPRSDFRLYFGNLQVFFSSLVNERIVRRQKKIPPIIFPCTV
jgi:hypothetical protein